MKKKNELATDLGEIKSILDTPLPPLNENIAVDRYITTGDLLILYNMRSQLEVSKSKLETAQSKLETAVAESKNLENEFKLLFLNLRLNYGMDVTDSIENMTGKIIKKTP